MKVIAAGQVAKPIVLGAAPRRTPVVVLAGLRGAPGTGGGGSAGVSSFNGRTGVVSLTGSDVTAALAYTPANAASLSAVALSGSYADLADKPFIPTGPGDIGAASAAQGALADTAVQPGALSVQLDLKVDKVAGYGLSQENFTAAEKAKLAGLEGSHFKGVFASLVALQSAFPTASAGDYADVDAGVGSATIRYVWDDSDAEWQPVGAGTPLTAADIKTLYESNPDTNAYTDAEKSKLSGIAAGATANANTDSLAEGASNFYHTAARVLNTVLAGLSLASGAAVVDTDGVLVAFGKLQRQINDMATAISGKQETLVSGTNIKTINGSNLLGSGDLSTIAGLPSRTVTASGAVTPADAGHWLICDSASPIALTIGAEATAAWTVPGILPMFHILVVGAGAVTVVGDGFSVTVHEDDTNVLDGAGAAATAAWLGTAAWRLFGRLVAV